MECKICGGSSYRLFSAKVLFKHDVEYYQCSRCKFIQTEDPYWLSEAYNNVITTLDIGLLYRNIYLLPIVGAMLSFFFDRKKKFIDFGGGYGIFVRLMRDSGFDFYRQDVYCENLFAKYFENDESQLNFGYEVLTAFEVFEHLANPNEEVIKMLKFSDNILFSTELQPKRESDLLRWWYFAPETGQHISFYTAASLEILARKNGLKFYSNGRNIHLMTKKAINRHLFSILTNYKIAFLYKKLFARNKGLLQPDFNYILNDIRSKNC